jgi:hypothetical protein
MQPGNNLPLNQLPSQKPGWQVFSFELWGVVSQNLNTKQLNKASSKHEVAMEIMTNILLA